jgi:hypothetical protein
MYYVANDFSKIKSVYIISIFFFLNLGYVLIWSFCSKSHNGENIVIKIRTFRTVEIVQFHSLLCVFLSLFLPLPYFSFHIYPSQNKTHIESLYTECNQLIHSSKNGERNRTRDSRSQV